MKGNKSTLSINILRYFLVFLFLGFNLVFVTRVSGQTSAEISYSQQFILPNNFETNDVCGSFYRYFDYEPVTGIQFKIVGGNPDNLFSIDSYSGTITTTRTQDFAPSFVYLLIQTSDGERIDVDTALIQIIDSSRCVFIDPSSTSYGDGSRSNPFKSWKSFSFVPGYYFLQKRGTTYSEDEISIKGPGGTAENHIVLGAYGSGNRPVLDGSKLDQLKGGIWFGSTQSVTGYIDIYSFIAHSSRGIEAERGTHDVRLFDCETYNCHDNAGIYFKEVYNDLTIPLNIEMYNCVSHDNYNTHGIKTAPGSHLMNCLVYNNRLANGVSVFNQSSINHCLAYQNDQYGLEGDGDDILIQNSRAYGNFIGIYHNTSSNGIIKNCKATYNTYGISIDYYTTNIRIEECELTSNSIGIEVAGGCEDIEIIRNHSYNNNSSGISIQEHIDAPGNSRNVYVIYNLLHDNKLKGLNISYVQNTYVYNNTIIGNNLSVESTASGTNVVNNIISAAEGSFTGSHNLIDPDPLIFFDINSKDYHLKPTMTTAIDNGTDLGLNMDLDRSMVPNGTNPDIGAYEYEGVYYEEPPSAPGELTGLAEGYSSVSLSWIDNSDIEFGFDIERSTGSSTSFSIVKSLKYDNTHFVDQNLEPVTTYNYRIRAYNNKGYSEYSDVVSVTTPLPPVPDVPSGLKLTSVSKNQAIVTWSDNSSVESGFSVYYKLTSSSDYIKVNVPRNTTQYAIQGLNASTNYQAKVAAYNIAGQSGYSNEITFRTSDLQIPLPPSNLSVSYVTVNSISLLWTDNSLNENGFQLYRSLSETSGYALIATPGRNVRSYTDNTTSQGVTYYYRVRSYNQDGYSEFSPVREVVAIPFNTPAAPASLSVSETSYDYIALSWSDNSSDETGFRLERTGSNSNSKMIFNLNRNTTSFADTGLVSNTKYTYTICAYNDYGSSLYSNNISVYTQILTLPEAPSGFKVSSVSSKSIQLEWDDNSNNESNFLLVRTNTEEPDSVVTLMLNSNVTTYTDLSLQPGTVYTYELAAQNKAGSSDKVNTNAYMESNSELLRVKDGLIAYYNFILDKEMRIKDMSLNGLPLNLEINNPENVKWTENRRFTILGNASIVSSISAAKIVEACKQTSEISVECWVKPSGTSNHINSSIISLGRSDNDQIFSLKQNYLNSESGEGFTYETTLQTESTNSQGYPVLISDDYLTSVNLQHIVYCRDSLGYEKIYINGSEKTSGYRPTGFDTWDASSVLKIGNDFNGGAGWYGTFYSLAFYDQALSSQEVQKNYKAGPADNISTAGFIYDVFLYPNPGTDYLMLKMIPTENADIYGKTFIRVLNLYGGIISHEEEIFDPSTSILKILDIKDLTPGMYYIQIISGTSSESFKFSKM